MRQAVLLVPAGWASRLAAPVAGEPFLGHLAWNLSRHGVRDLLVCVEDGVDSLHIPGGIPAHGAELTVLSPHPGGAGFPAGRADVLDERFLVLDGRVLFDINYLDLALAAGRSSCAALRSGRGPASCAREGDPVQNHGGVCLLRREDAAVLPAEARSLGRDVLPLLAERGRLAFREYAAPFLDQDTPEADVGAWRRRPALFLDRDGVLNVDHGYVHRPMDLDWCPGARLAVKAANDAGWLVIVVTNQSGIARGYFPEEAFFSFMEHMRAELAEVGAHFDAVYHCPHHPQGAVEALRKACDCRKPGPGMLLRAAAEWDVDMARSVVVGDSARDIEAGLRAGVGQSLLFDPQTMDLAGEVAALLGRG